MNGLHKRLAILSKEAYEKNMTSISHDVHKLSDDESGTTCFILFNKEEQIVVFRGTEIEIKDIKTDLNFKDKNGVHEGFLTAYKSIEKELMVILDTRKTTYFCGHSLGGALALLAFVYSPIFPKNCVTFGAPKVFKKIVAENYGSYTRQITQYQNYSDIVPHCPPFAGYRHIGIIHKQGSFLDSFFTNLEEKIKKHSIENYIKEFN